MRRLIIKIFYIITLLLFCNESYALTISEQDKRFYPFNLNLERAFVLSGTLSTGQGPPHIEAQYLNYADNSVLEDWTQLTSETIINETSWTGTLTVGLHDAEGYFKVRLSNATGTTAQTANRCSPSFIGAVFGQSNAKYFFTNGTAAANAGFCYYTINGTTFTTNFPGYGGSNFANTLKSIFNCPIVLLDYGVPGAALDSTCDIYGMGYGWWEKDPSGSHYVGFVAACVALGEISSFFYHQGESDGFCSESYEDYLANEQQLRSDLRTDVSSNIIIPWITAAIGKYQSNGILNINKAKVELFDDENTHGIVGTDFTMYDDAHYTSDSTGYGRMQNRWAQCVRKHWGLSTWDRGPIPIGYKKISATSTYIYVQLNGDATTVTPTSNIDSFEVLLGGVWTNVSCSLSSVAGNIAILSCTHSSGTVTGARSLWDGYNTPTTYILRDDSDLTLPVEPLWSIPEYTDKFASSVTVSAQFEANKAIPVSFSDQVTVSYECGTNWYPASFSDSVTVTSSFMKTRPNVYFQNVYINNVRVKE
ncbi:MAG: sialate O-acetylesterase [Pseudomonadota bacterium]